MKARWFSLATVLGAAVLFACSGSNSRSGFDDGSSGGSSGNGSSGGNGFGGGDDGGPGGAACVPNPANAEIPDNNCDDDGDGIVDNVPTCDTGLSQNGTAEDMAKAIGICDKAASRGFGLVSATFTRGYGRTDAPQDGQHGILGKFGDVIKPREGVNLGVLSTGYGEEFDGSPGTAFGEKAQGKDWYNFGPYDPSKTGNGTAPMGFPKPATGCTNVQTTNDVIDLKLQIKAPPNGSGIKFDFNFYSSEWPAWICTEFNDSFVAYLSAKGFNNGTPDNMSFDKNNNPVSVNNGFFDRCTSGATTGCGENPFSSTTASCPGGPGELAGTGFGLTGMFCPGSSSTAGGATGWLTSQAPVQPGETFTLEFIIWDTGDAVLDSSVLIDHFTWVGGKVEVGTVRPN